MLIIKLAFQRWVMRRKPTLFGHPNAHQLHEKGYALKFYRNSTVSPTFPNSTWIFIYFQIDLEFEIIIKVEVNEEMISLIYETKSGETICYYFLESQYTYFLQKFPEQFLTGFSDLTFVG